MTFSKATPQDIIKASKKTRTSQDPVLIEELFLASLLQEMDNNQKDSKGIFDAFYREIKKPLRFIPIRAQVLWWAFSVLYNGDEYKSLDCKTLISFFSVTDNPLKKDVLAGTVDKDGKHTSIFLKAQHSQLDHQAMIDYIEVLCDKEVEFSATEYFTIWRSASADKIRISQIEQLHVRLQKTGNWDSFYEEMAKTEEEYRKVVSPSHAKESQSLSLLDANKVTDIISGTTSKNHFIPLVENELNNKIFGFPRQGLSLITGITGGGKSLHLLRYAYNAFTQGKKVFYISLELSEQRVLRELMTIGGGIPNSEIERATSKEEMNALTIAFLDKAKKDAKRGGAFYYDICIDLELQALLDIARVHAVAFGIDLICIDLYDEIPIPAEFIANPNGKGGYFESMLNAWIQVARDYNCAVAGAVQLKADAVLNGKVQQEGIGGSIWYAKKSSLILYCHRSSDEYMGKSHYAIEVLKDRESGGGWKGAQVVKAIDRDTKYVSDAYDNTGRVIQTIQFLEKKIAQEQKKLEQELI